MFSLDFVSTLHLASSTKTTTNFPTPPLGIFLPPMDRRIPGLGLDPAFDFADRSRNSSPIFAATTDDQSGGTSQPLWSLEFQPEHPQQQNDQNQRRHYAMNMSQPHGIPQHPDQQQQQQQPPGQQQQTPQQQQQQQQQNTGSHSLPHSAQITHALNTPEYNALSNTPGSHHLEPQSTIPMIHDFYSADRLLEKPRQPGHSGPGIVSSTSSLLNVSQTANGSSAGGQGNTSASVAYDSIPRLTLNSSPDIERERARSKYKARSSIPTELSSSHYAAQCAAAAVSSRLDPYSLDIDEHDLLRSYIPHIHVTTYLNIRNGILRLWMANPTVSVTIAEAAGCARDERFFGLAEFAYEWLVRRGYINFGCVDTVFPTVEMGDIETSSLKPRPTVLVIGAGIAGLGFARQLESLVKQYACRFSSYEDVPRIIVLEGRRRIGGRIYSAPLKSDSSAVVDLGAHIIMGYGAGNPLGVLVRRQLGLPIEPMAPPAAFYDEVTRDQVDQETEKRGDLLYRHLLKRIADFKNVVPRPRTAEGDHVLMHAAKDPSARDEAHETQTLAKFEESGGPDELGGKKRSSAKKYVTEETETLEELKFLKSIGIYEKDGDWGLQSDRPPFKHKIHVVPEPQGDVHPSLGQTFDGAIHQLKDAAQLSLMDIQLLNWHLANLEYSAGTHLDNLSLGSWNQDEGHDFSGRYSVIKNGYMSLMRGLYKYSENLDVRFNTCAKVIEYDDCSSHVFLENGERLHADRVIVTAPLGVLKDRTLQFIPDLPQWKKDSIDRLGFGTTNKVCLVYQEAFWDEDQDIFCCVRGPMGTGTSQQDFEDIRGEFYMFWNCSKAVGRPCLVGLLTGNASDNVVAESDEELVDKAQAVIMRVINNIGKPVQLVESVVTRWQIDPFSRGSYSYVGPEATGADYDLMARPINKSVFFAGEATCRSYPGTVHGAYLSGLRAANEVLTSFIGDMTVPQPLILSKDHRTRSQFSSSKGTPNYRLDEENLLAAAAAAAAAASSASAPPPHPPMVQAPPQPIPSVKRTLENIDAAEEDLRRLREDRVSHDNERMRHDLIKELGERPVKPERSGANPFLIFQKDFWDKCRQETDKLKQETTKDSSARATRNEVRAALGKMWREFPEDSKKPYLEQTASIKETNNKKTEEFRRRVRQYDSEAEDFRRRWKEANSSPPSTEELRLSKAIHDATVGDRKRRR